MRTSKCTCLIFGVSIGLDHNYKCTKGIFDRNHRWEENEHFYKTFECKQTCCKQTSFNEQRVCLLVQTIWAQVQGHTRHIADHLWMASSYFSGFGVFQGSSRTSINADEPHLAVAVCEVVET